VQEDTKEGPTHSAEPSTSTGFFVFWGKSKITIFINLGAITLGSVTPEVREMLTKHIDGTNPDSYVLEIKGRPLTTDRLYKVWTNACTRAKVKPISLQQAITTQQGIGNHGRVQEEGTPGNCKATWS
jgi:hypothetical protein